MIEAGGLIKLHYHNNFDILELLSETGGILYYNNKPLFHNVHISLTQNNILEKKEDGLFVDGTFLKRFTYSDNELRFDNVIVSREYSDDDIQTSINNVWTGNTQFHQIGHLDLSYFLQVIQNDIYRYECINNYRSTMHLKIDNPEEIVLELYLDSTKVRESDLSEIFIDLGTNRHLIVQPKGDFIMHISVSIL